MADKEQFQSIYGDSESEFDIEDVSDETTSIPKEQIEEIVEENKEQPSEETTSEEPVSEEIADAETVTDTTDSSDAGETVTDTVDSSDTDEKVDTTISDDITFDDHHAPAEDDDDPDDVYTDKSEEETDDEKVGVISYILHAILFTIPVIGTIVMLVYIISDKKNSHLRHFAQIWLVTLLLIAIGAYAAITILGIA